MSTVAVASVGEAYASADSGLGIESKRIAKVIVRSGDIIDAVRLVFTDGSSSLSHGGVGGSENVFELSAGEEIVKIRYSADKDWITRLQFVTSDGKRSGAVLEIAKLTFRSEGVAVVRQARRGQRQGVDARRPLGARRLHRLHE